MKQIIKRLSDKELKLIYEELVKYDINKESNSKINLYYKYIYILSDCENISFNEFKETLFKEINERNIHFL